MKMTIKKTELNFTSSTGGLYLEVKEHSWPLVMKNFPCGAGPQLSCSHNSKNSWGA